MPLAEVDVGTGAGLAAAARSWLRAHPGARTWRALARALAQRAASRSWPWRAVAVVQSAEELDRAFARLLERGPDAAPGEPFFSAADRATPGAPSRHAFVIGGTGAQWPGMGQSLLGHRAFRQAMTECDVAFSGKVDFAPSEMLIELGNRPNQLDQLHIAAICNFALCFSLDRQLRAWGVLPSAIAGHSMGEIVGAALAGALSLRDAAAVMVAWCQVQGGAQPGEMLVVGLPAAEALTFVERAAPTSVSLAARNSPRSTTLAGAPAALAALRDRLVAAGHRCRLLHTGGAFHSHLMEPLRAPLLARLPALAPRPPELAFYSTVGRGPADADADAATRFTAEHWWRNLRNPVDFAGAVRRLADDGHDALWELAPHPTLSASIAECVEGQAREPALFATLQRDRDAAASLLASVGRYYAGGGELAWDELYRGDGEEAEAAAVELGEVTALPLSSAASSPGTSAAALRAAPAQERRARLLREVTAMAAALLGVPAEELRGERSWLELGLESLHAVKLKAQLQRELQLEVPLVRFLSGEPLHHFVDELLRQLAARPPAPSPEVLLRGAQRAARDAVGALGADEVDALLAQLVRRCPPEELTALLREVEVAS